jgi:hypothetical protein
VPFTIERLPGEPIIIVRCSGHLDSATFTDIFEQTITLMTEQDKTVYRIVDYHAVTTPFLDVLRAARDASTGNPAGSTTDPRIKPVMVGGETWLAAARQAFESQPFGSVTIPMFTSVAEAAAFARQSTKE